MATKIFPMVDFPLDAYFRNVKIFEVHIGRGEPYTIIEHLKRWIKKVWQGAINTEHMKTVPKVAPLFKKNLGGGESWDLFSKQQMGLEVQKNLGLLMLSEVEGGS